MGCTWWHAPRVRLDPDRSGALAASGQSATLGADLVPHADHRQVRLRVEWHHGGWDLTLDEDADPGYNYRVPLPRYPAPTTPSISHERDLPHG